MFRGIPLNQYSLLKTIIYLNWWKKLVVSKDTLIDETDQLNLINFKSRYMIILKIFQLGFIGLDIDFKPFIIWTIS